MKLNDQEMNTMLGLIIKADPQQLLQANRQIRSTLDVRARQATGSIVVGSKVKWDGKHGPKAGTVIRVKQKYVEVLEDGGKNLRWNVTASMLKPVGP